LGEQHRFASKGFYAKTDLTFSLEPAMKSMLATVAIVFGFVAVVPIAGAEPAPPVDQSEATLLETQPVSVEQTEQAPSTALPQLEAQINHGTDSDDDAQPQGPLAELEEALSLPEGMVVRGTRGGGLVVGGEF
jgi:hypothetical protein